MSPEDFIGAGRDWLPEKTRPAPALEKPLEPLGPEDYAVLWIPVYCPKCGNRNCPAYDSGDKVTRYHKCGACGINFKSIEVLPDPVKKRRIEYAKR